MNSGYAPILISLIFGLIHDSSHLELAYQGYRWEKLAENNHGSLWGNIAAHMTRNMCVTLRDCAITLFLVAFIKDIDNQEKKHLDNLINSNKKIL